MRVRRPRVFPGRSWSKVALSALLLVAMTASPAGSAPGAAPTALTAGLVTRSGAQLQVAGAPWRFAGYNLPCANPFLLSPDELGFYLDGIKATSGAKVVRAWFFQTNGGPGNWEPFDRVVAAVKARDMRLVATLTDEWNGGCDAGAGDQKTVDWYQGGYRQPDFGHTLAYRDYAAQVAARYAGEPAVAMWQLVNEAQANTRLPSGQLICDNEAGKLALRSFGDDMVGLLKAVDPGHLVNLGTLGGSQCGMAGSAAYRYIHDGLVDVCEYHDYGSSASPMPTGPDLLAQRIDDCGTLPSGAKPLFIGEAGIQGNVQPDGGPAPGCQPWPGCTGVPVTVESLVRRAEFFDAKIKAAFDAGVAGYVIWVKSPFYSPTTDTYAIGEGDPTEGALGRALTGTPGPTAPTITSVKRCNRGAIVTWSPPADQPDAPTAYDVTGSHGVTTSVPGTATTVTVKGLTNGRSYTFTVTARGPDGPASEPSAPVVPSRSAKCGATSLSRLWSSVSGRK